MYIYGRTQPLSGGTVLEAIEALRECGFDGVELCFENPDILPSTVTRDKRAEIKEALKAFPGGFSVSYHKDITADDMFLETQIALQHVNALGACVFIISSYPRAGHTEDKKAFFVQRLRHILSAASAYGLTLALEPEPGFLIQSTADMLALIDEVDSPELAVNMDIGHAFLTDEDPHAMLRRIAPHIVHCHVEGMDKGIHLHRPPYEGDLDVPAYIQTLKDGGFDGPLALDLYKEDYRAVAPGCIEFLRGAMGR